MPHSEEWGAKLQKDSPDLVLRLERAPPTPGSGDTLRGSCGQRARARGLGAALGARSQRPRGRPARAPWLQITGAALGRPAAREPARCLARDHRPGLRTPGAGREAARPQPLGSATAGAFSRGGPGPGKGFS